MDIERLGNASDNILLLANKLAHALSETPGGVIIITDDGTVQRTGDEANIQGTGASPSPANQVSKANNCRLGPIKTKTQPAQVAGSGK